MNRTLHAARLGRRLGDPRHVTWQEEARATAQRCGMRALASQLLPDADSTSLPLAGVRPAPGARVTRHE
jgi:hypothetical protein